MKSIRIIIAITLLACGTAAAQPLTDGFYLSVDCSLGDGVKRKSLSNPKDAVCLSRQPFLSLKEIRSISVVTNSGGISSFDVLITNRAADQINAIYTTIKKAHVALVVEDQISFVIKFDDVTPVYSVLRVESTVDLEPIRKKIVTHWTQATTAKADHE